MVTLVGTRISQETGKKSQTLLGLDEPEHAWPVLQVTLIPILTRHGPAESLLGAMCTWAPLHALNLGKLDAHFNCAGEASVWKSSVADRSLVKLRTICKYNHPISTFDLFSDSLFWPSDAWSCLCCIPRVKTLLFKMSSVLISPLES